MGSSRLGATVLAGVCVLMMIGACTGDSPSGSPAGVPTLSPSPTSANSSTPTPAATPTASPLAAFAAGSLVLRLAEGRGIGPYRLALSVYSDGRLLTIDGNTASLLQRTLTPQGVAQLTAEVTATGFFAKSHDVPTIVKSGVTPPATEGGGDLFLLDTTNGRIRVSTASPEQSWMQHSDERVALHLLTERLSDLSSLGAGAWKDSTPVPFDSGRWLMWFGTSTSFGSPETDADASTIWPFAAGPADIGQPFTSADHAQSVENRCLVVGSATIRDLVSRLRSHGIAQGTNWTGTTNLPWRDLGVDLQMDWRVLFPDESPTCEGKSYPPAITP